jgi:predicted secreted protein
MNKLSITFAVSLAVGASALFMAGASAAPLTNGVTTLPEGNVQNVRMVCNENGRCWRQRGDRVIIRESRDSYDYAPRERYIERRGYEERGPGVGIQAPGVSVGIGTGRY